MVEDVAYSNLLDHGDDFSLSFPCGDLPSDPVVSSAGHEPNGYFWEGVAAFIAPELVAHLDLDSEGGMFSASGSEEDCSALRAKLEPLLANPQEMLRVLQRARSEGFPFDD